MHPLVDTARRFAAEVVDPQAAAWEHDRRLPRHAITAAAEAGLCGLVVPEELGGQGLGVTEMAQVLAALAAADMGFTFSLVCHNNLAGAIAANGTPHQQDRYLPGMLGGLLLGAFLLTEPGTGSDAAAITTTAVADGDRWRLNGAKAWVTNATHADVLSVYAQTRPGAGSRGIAGFLVDADQEGVIREPGYEMLGAHSTGTGGFRFEEVALGPDQLMTPPPRAFGAALGAIDLARVVVSAMCAGMLDRSLEVALDHVSRRQAFGQPLSAQQGLRWMLADVATDLEAARALTATATTALDTGADDRGVRAAHAKKFATRVALDGIAQCMQALGASGFRHDQPLARHLASAKMAQYLDGTTEIQNVVIARSLFSGRSH